MNNTISKPNFLIIGAAKAATTSLSNMLNLHPQAAMVQTKEPHFFSYDDVYNQGWDYYQSLYAHCKNELVAGDASTSYSRIRYHPQVANRILKHVPNVKIIYMVRHPLDRMASAYVERLGAPGEDQIFKSVNHAVKRQPMIIDSSRYWEVFDYYRQHFDESKIKIVWFEEFVKNTDYVFQDICCFLGIENNDSIITSSSQRNSRDHVIQRMNELGRGDIKIRTNWNKKTLKWVVDQLKDDNTKFLKYFNKPKDYWENYLR